MIARALGRSPSTVCREIRAGGGRERYRALAAERLATALQSPVLLAGREVSVTASIGVALRAADQGSADQLMRDADLAVYRAKARGKAQYAMFESGMAQESGERFEIDVPTFSLDSPDSKRVLN